MDICVRLFCFCVVLCVGSGVATGWSPVQGILPTTLGLRNWSETKRFTDALCSKVGATGKRERLSKSTKFLSQDNQCTCRDYNRASPKHKSKELLFEPVCSLEYYEFAPSWFLLLLSVTPVGNSTACLIICYTINCPAFSLIPLRCYMLSNDASRLAFVSTLHE
jgi:hypothetical protein